MLMKFNFQRLSKDVREMFMKLDESRKSNFASRNINDVCAKIPY